MSSNKSSSLNCFGIGCMVLMGLPLLTIIGFNSGGVILPLILVVGLIAVVAAVRKQNKNNAQGVVPPAIYNTTAANSTPVPRATTVDMTASNITTVAAPVSAKLSAGEFTTSICGHSFTAEDLEGQKTVKCPCGYEYEVATLREYRKLQLQLAQTQSKLDAVLAKLRAIRMNTQTESLYGSWTPTGSTQRTAASTATPTTTVAQPTKPVVAPKPAKPVVHRNKVAVSAQQWLIIGASILVMVAGTIFVGSNLNNLAPWQFLAITAGVAAVTGFVAIWGRKISVMLANFMASFSSAMQIASVLLIGVLFVANGQWAWNSAPAWWWSIDLAVTSALAFGLTRFKPNFAWKVVSLTSLVASVLVLNFGVLQNANLGYGWVGAVTTAAAVLLALMSKAVKTFKLELPKDKNDAAYEKDLAERENAALQRFTMAAASLLTLTGLGYVVVSLATSITSRIEPLSLAVFTAVWIGAGAIQELWISELSPSKELQARINSMQHVVGFVSVALTIQSLLALANNVWVSTVGTAAFGFVAVVLAQKVKRIGAHPVAISSAHYTLLASWVIWQAIPNLQNYTVLGAGLISFALSLLYKHVVNDSRGHAMAASVIHAVGLAILAKGANFSGSYTSVSYAAATLVVGLLAVAYSPLVAIIDKRHKSATEKGWHGIVLLLSVGLNAIMLMPDTSAYVHTQQQLLPMTLTFMISGAATLWLAVSGRAGELRNLLLSYSGVYQAIALGLLGYGALANDNSLTSVILVSLGFINYLMALLGKYQPTAQIGYVLVLLGAANQIFNATPNGVVNLAIAAVAGGALNFVHAIAVKRANGTHLGVVSALSTGLLVLGSVLQTRVAYQGSLGTPLVIELAVIALAYAAWAERKTGSDALAMRLVGVGLTVVNVLALSQSNWSTDELIATATFTVIALRALVISSKQNEPSAAVWTLLSYIGSITTVVIVIFNFNLLNTTIPEDFAAIAIGASFVAPAFFHRGLSAKAKPILRLDIPVLVALSIELALGYVENIFSIGEAPGARVTISLLLLTGFTYWRSVAEKQMAWVMVGYLTGFGTALSLAAQLTQGGALTSVVYETNIVLISLSLVVGALFLRKQVSISSQVGAIALFDVPMLLPVVAEVAYGVSKDVGSTSSLLRLLAATAALFAYAHFKMSKQKVVGLAVLAYAAATGFIATAVSLIYSNGAVSWSGPEIFAVALTLAVFVGNYELRRVIEFKSSLPTWGLPLAVLLLPSTLYSLSALGKSFAELSGEEVTRIIAVLVVGLVALLLGVRQGNLGATIVGAVTLTLIVVPLAWARSGDVGGDASVSLRSLLIGVLLFAAFTGLQRAKIGPTSSYFYLGIPMTVALAPSIYLTIVALNNPQLTSVDWWRFCLIVAVSLTLLIVGALRELGGLFFPGLAGVLVAVLPYAFKPLVGQAWLLWVLLLVIAGVMVWIAVRLEQMRKLGKSSVSWVKALK